jgi:hypothetical protein
MTSEKSKQRAKKALKKEAVFGEDLNLESYEYESSDMKQIESLEELESSDQSIASEVGFDVSGKKASGSFIQFDNESFLADVMMQQEGLEVMPIREALEKYDWAQDYLWNAVPVDVDKYTATSELNPYNGYFIRAKAGAKIQMPVQTCLIMKKNQSVQNVHNIIMAEEGSELHIITGCATPSNLERSLHLGISEFYVQEDAKLSFTMVHKWSEQTDVRPRSAIHVEAGGVFLSTYAVLSPLKSIQTFPKVRLQGIGAKADLYSVVYGSKDSYYDIGGSLSLEAEKTNGKVISRSIATDSAEIVARGDLIGLSPKTRARLECDGLLLSDEGAIRAVPMLNARAEGTELSHEATVGKVGAEQLTYLMSRGLDEEEATSLIVNGFVKLEVPDLPPDLQRSIDNAIKLAVKAGL